MATTIVGPLFISSMQLAINDPGLVFNSKRKNKWSMTVGVILTSLVNPIILSIAHENIQEKIRKSSKRSDQNVLEKLKYQVIKMKEIKINFTKLLKVDLGLELIYQLTDGNITTQTRTSLNPLPTLSILDCLLDTHLWPSWC